MSFKDVLKDTIKLGGCFGVLVMSGGLVAAVSYRLGYTDAYSQATTMLKNVINETTQKTVDDKTE